MPYDADLEVDAAIMEIAQAWGIRTDRVAPIVDEYGIALSRAAFLQVQEEMTNGFAVQKPFGYMVSLLRKGVIQAQAVSSKADPHLDWCRQRYENAQADPSISTALKRLNAVKLEGELAGGLPIGKRP